jgi:hypothetical protein
MGSVPQIRRFFGTNIATYAYLTNSALVDNVAFKSGTTTRNKFDNLDRLTRKASQTGAVTAANFTYESVLVTSFSPIVLLPKLAS